MMEPSTSPRALSILCQNCEFNRWQPCRPWLRIESDDSPPIVHIYLLPITILSRLCQAYSYDTVFVGWRIRDIRRRTSAIWSVRDICTHPHTVTQRKHCFMLQNMVETMAIYKHSSISVSVWSPSACGPQTNCNSVAKPTAELSSAQAMQRILHLSGCPIHCPTNIIMHYRIAHESSLACFHLVIRSDIRSEACCIIFRFVANTWKLINEA